MTFEAIIAAARAADEQALTRALTRPRSFLGFKPGFLSPITVSSIDLRQQSAIWLTPAGELARQENIPAVEFLRQHGASVHAIALGFAIAGNHLMVEKYHTEFGASKDYIGYGYAIGGHLDEVKHYLLDHHASPDILIQGLAIAGNEEAVAEYLAQYPFCKNSAGYGFALAGHTKAALASEASPDVLIKGLAAGGCADSAERYLTQLPHPRKYANQMAQGLAMSGDAKRVDWYFMSRSASHTVIAQGYAIAGYVELAEEYLHEDKATKDAIAQGYAIGGHFALAEKLCTAQGASRKATAEGLAMGGYYKEADEYHTKYLTSPEDRISREVTTRGFAKAGFLHLAETFRGKWNTSIDAIIDGLQDAGCAELAARYRDAAPIVISGTTTEELALAKYVEELRTKPITVVEGYDYSKEQECGLSLYVPKIPVRIGKTGPFDLNSLFTFCREADSYPARYKHPLVQDGYFKIQDIVPATDLRDELNKIAEDHAEKQKKIAEEAAEKQNAQSNAQGPAVRFSQSEEAIVAEEAAQKQNAQSNGQGPAVRFSQSEESIVAETSSPQKPATAYSPPK